MKGEIFISGVILASGFGRRAGGDKLGLAWGSHTVLYNAIKSALFSELDEVIVVVQPRHMQLCKKYIALFVHGKTHVVINTQAHEGMAASVRLGVKNCHAESNAVLFLLADQVFFQSHDINAMCAMYKRDKPSILAAFYNEERKNPVLFSLDLYKKELLCVHGDMGARNILQQCAKSIARFTLHDSLKCVDIDTQEEYVTYGAYSFSWVNVLAPYRLVSVMGAGGKTSLLWNMGQEFWKIHKPCIVTTTTRMWRHTPDGVSLVLSGDRQDFIHELKKNGYINTLLGLEVTSDQKLLGLPYETLDFIQQDNTAVTLLAEADGAQGKIFKAHTIHEPCIPPKSDLVILVVNMGIIGKLLSGEYVHRPELLPKYFPFLDMLVDKSVDKSGCTVSQLAQMLLSPHGYLAKAVPAIQSASIQKVEKHIMLFFNGVESRKDYRHMVELLGLLHKSLCSAHAKGQVHYVYGSNKYGDYTYIDVPETLI